MAAKLPLAVRKHMRDNYEAKVPELQKRFMEYLGEQYELVPNTEAFYPVLDSAGRGSQIGEIVLDYFQNAADGVRNLTDGGQNEEYVSLFNSVATARKVSLVVDTQFLYCGSRFNDGVLEIVMNPESVWTNVSEVNESLVRQLDIKLLDRGELPVTTRRAVKKHVDSNVYTMEETFKKMFNKDYTAEYDVLKTLQTIKAATFAEAPNAEYWYQDNLFRVAEILGTYFEDVAKGLEDRGFGNDDLLQEGFVEAAGKGIVRFELTDELPTGKYSTVTFEDGVVFIRTTIDCFGVNMGSEITDGVIEAL